MKIAVIDDERPARSELSHLLRELEPDAVIFEADCGNQALELLGQQKFDLLFIDINLGDIDGIALAATVKNLMPQARVIFATAYSEYAAKAYEMGIDDYILKPFEKARLERIIQRVRGLAPASAPDKLAVNSEHRILFLDISSVIYIETSNRGSMIHTHSGDIFENLTIGEYERRLPSQKFFRIHKSYLVNLDMVSELFPWQAGGLGLKMKGCNVVLPVGRERSKELRRLLKVQTM